jgi:hypothetical protein
MVNAFEGNKAETATMLPTIKAFMEAHQLQDVTMVADAGIISDASKRAIEAAGLSFILGVRIPDVPYVVEAWRQEHPEEPIPDGHIFVQPWPADQNDGAGTSPSATSTGPSVPAARCAGSTSRSPSSPAPQDRQPGRRRPRHTRLCRTPDLRKRLAGNAWTRAQGHSWQRIAERLRSILHMLTA